MSIKLESGFAIPQDVEDELTSFVEGCAVKVEKKAKTANTKARNRATKKKEKEPKPAESLLNALKFISAAQSKVGPVEAQHSKASHGWICATNGILTIAHPIEEDLTACPQTMLFIEALSKVKDELAITQLSERTLSVSSQAFKGLVPCAAENEISIPAPDDNIALLNNAVKKALSDVLVLATDGSPNATFASVLLHKNSAVATNGGAMLESWHGVDLPPNMLLPKAAAVAIAKSPYDLTGFGYSGSSATFYFANGAFIKTQLYGERYPSYEHLLSSDYRNAVAITPEFFQGLKTLASFSPDGSVYFKDGKLHSNVYTEQSSSYILEGLPEDMAFNIKYLQMLEPFFVNVSFDKVQKKAFFHNEGVRGALMGLRYSNEHEASGTAEDHIDDNLPF